MSDGICVTTSFQKTGRSDAFPEVWDTAAAERLINTIFDQIESS